MKQTGNRDRQQKLEARIKRLGTLVSGKRLGTGVATYVGKKRKGTRNREQGLKEDYKD